MIVQVEVREKNQCWTCKHALCFLASGVRDAEDDAVNCDSLKLAVTLTDPQKRDFEMNGFLKLFRVEVITPDRDCIGWDPRPAVQVMEDQHIFLIKMKKESHIEDAVVFSYSKEEVEKTQPQPLPHYVGWSWDNVEKVVEITENQMNELIKKGEAGLADI